MITLTNLNDVFNCSLCPICQSVLKLKKSDFYKEEIHLYANSLFIKDIELSTTSMFNGAIEFYNHNNLEFSLFCESDNHDFIQLYQLSVKNDQCNVRKFAERTFVLLDTKLYIVTNNFIKNICTIMFYQYDLSFKDRIFLSSDAVHFAERNKNIKCNIINFTSIEDIINIVKIHLTFE